MTSDIETTRLVEAGRINLELSVNSCASSLLLGNRSLSLARAIGAVVTERPIAKVWGKVADHLHTIRFIVHDRKNTTTLYDKPHSILMN